MDTEKATTLNIKEEIICFEEISNFHGIRGKFISTEELILKENECCYFEKGELYGFNITDVDHTREYYKKVLFSV